MSARKILVVDDNDNVRSFLVLLLERSGGYETLEAATGEEAVEKAISGRPDLILMDIRLTIQARPRFQLLLTLLCI